MSVGHHGLEDGRDYRLTIGSSFHPSKAKDAYHLMRYDFKPASIDTSRPAVVVVGEHNQCTVTIPNIQEGGGTTQYKGGKKPCTKECVLIIDKEAGTITLERISSSISLKKCRADKSHKISAVPSKQNKPVSTQNVSAKSSATSHSTSTSSNHAPINTASTTMSAAVTSTMSSSSKLNANPGAPVTSTMSSSSKHNTNPGKRKSTVQKQRLMSDMSVSSSSSYSSDSDDDGDALGNKLEAQLSAAKQPKPENRIPVKPPPTKVAPAKPKPQKSMFSTLQSDLQLSDSNDSDSD